MSIHPDYQQFVQAKAAVAFKQGVPISAGAVNPLLKGHQRAIVEWAIEGGRRAIFAAFGLGKTFMQLEAVRCSLDGCDPDALGLIVAPLGVRQEFRRDAATLGIRLEFIRSMEEARALAADGARIFITNYETVRDGRLDPRNFEVTSLDEASCLRGFGGTKTFREFMKLFAGDDRESGVRTEGVRFRFVATATPSPNDYIELLAYAAYLGIMDVGEAKTRFFRRNSEKADELTLHPHKEDEFWLWVSSWAVFLQKPSDLGFSDEGYNLPPLTLHHHEVQSDLLGRETERDGQGILLRDAALGVVDAAREKRDSLPARIEKMKEIISAAPDDHFIIWHDLEAERFAIEQALPHRIIPGGINGMGFQTLSTFHADCIYHFKKHGFAFMGMKTIVTDVVRENNQTYRLGWTEQCKDATKMGVGTPEYLLLFRKPQNDTSKSYADVPVVKAKKEWKGEAWINEEGYSRARWQQDAHAFNRSSGDRPLTAEEVQGVPADQVYKIWKAFNVEAIYDFEHHVRIGEALEMRGALPPTFMLLPPHSWHDDVWSDVARMRTLNGIQQAKGKEMHLCPLQFDIVERAIAQLSNPEDLVYDPFGGLMTVPYCALKLGRRGLGVELNPGYFLDGVAHCKSMEAQKAVPSLFDYAGIRPAKEAA